MKNKFNARKSRPNVIKDAGLAAPPWAQQAGKFMLAFIVLFIAINLAFLLIPLEWFELFYAQGTIFLLGLFGVQGSLSTMGNSDGSLATGSYSNGILPGGYADGGIALQEPVLVDVVRLDAPIGFSYLCTGLIEIAVVWSAIAASFGIDARRRIIGMAAGLAVAVIFNFARIISS